MEYEWTETFIMPSKTVNEWTMGVLALIATIGWIWFPPSASSTAVWARWCAPVPPVICDVPDGYAEITTQDGEFVRYMPLSEVFRRR